MKNILLNVKIEGKQDMAVSDWNAVCAVLVSRHYSTQALIQLHAELNAGLQVTTRGLTMAKREDLQELESFIKAPVLAHREMMVV